MKIAVLFGGPSPERNVSIASGAQVIKSLRSDGHEVVAVDISSGILGPQEEERMFRSTLSGVPPAYEKGLSIISILSEVISALKDVDLYFLALHGVPGEDGSIQAFLDLAGPHAARVLSAGCPLDLHPGAFPAGTATRTLLGKAGVTLWRIGAEAWHLEVARSLAGYARAFLAEAARGLPEA
ncbi:MAG TPA: sarcosine oxidase subunit gamma family protein [Deltaproteobacteria bacterium]|nr:sarcosine oxidase subunit gamma family protein [Deltaproteobacteria bacterium]